MIRKLLNKSWGNIYWGELGNKANDVWIDLKKLTGFFSNQVVGKSTVSKVFQHLFALKKRW